MSKNSKLFKNKLKITTTLIHHHKVVTCNITRNKRCLKLQKIVKSNKNETKTFKKLLDALDRTQKTQKRFKDFKRR